MAAALYPTIAVNTWHQFTDYTTRDALRQRSLAYPTPDIAADQRNDFPVGHVVVNGPYDVF
jgi:hypothetical protein